MDLAMLCSLSLLLNTLLTDAPSSHSYDKQIVLSILINLINVNATLIFCLLVILPFYIRWSAGLKFAKPLGVCTMPQILCLLDCCHCLCNSKCLPQMESLLTRALPWANTSWIPQNMCCSVKVGHNLSTWNWMLNAAGINRLWLVSPVLWFDKMFFSSWQLWERKRALSDRQKHMYNAVAKFIAISLKLVNLLHLLLK